MPRGFCEAKTAGFLQPVSAAVIFYGGVYRVKG
jgi:hypothetical protein